MSVRKQHVRARSGSERFVYSPGEDARLSEISPEYLNMRGYLFLWPYLVAEAIDAVAKAEAVERQRILRRLETEEEYWSHESTVDEVRAAYRRWKPTEVDVAGSSRLVIHAKPGDWDSAVEYQLSFVLTEKMTVELRASGFRDLRPPLMPGVLPLPRDVDSAKRVARQHVFAAMQMFADVNNPLETLQERSA